MSKVKRFVYYIEYKNGNEEIMDKSALEEKVDNHFDNFFNKVSRIVKKYWLQDENRKKICMTLFTIEDTFSPYEYIEHYRGLSKEVYGTDFLSEFDMEIITMFN